MAGKGTNDVTQCNSILIVEDDEAIRECLKETLELEGYRIFAASNGRDALEMLHRIELPCLVLLDLMMPVMNGWEFLEAKRADVALAALPVVVVSAVADKAMDTHVAGIVKKPIELDLLFKVVRQYCGQSK